MPSRSRTANRALQLSAAEARRLALAAQGLGVAHPRAPARRELDRLFRRLGAVQIDSVNVLVRSHYLPAFSRIGAYPTGAFDRLAYDGRRSFEYFGHAASFLPVELHPAMRLRMAREAEDPRWLAFLARVERERPGYVARVLAEIADRGALAPTDLADQGKREVVPTKYAKASILWWSWSDGKDLLEWLLWSGRLAVAGRRNFERLYDLPERVIAPEVLALPTPAEDETGRILVGIAARALGVATIADLADYFRLSIARTRKAVRELFEAGALREAEVEGWDQPAWLAAADGAPPVEAAALLSPFDSLVWFRARTERLFGFHYRIEIYTPEAKRRFGYFVLPFLLGDELVARVDLKSDRKAGTLLVPGAFLEAGAVARKTAPALAAELRRMAAWLGLERIEVGRRGDLAAALGRALAGT